MDTTYLDEIIEKYCDKVYSIIQGAVAFYCVPYLIFIIWSLLK